MKNTDLIKQGTKNVVLKVLANINIEDLSDSSNLFSIGLDSITAMTLVLKLQNTFDIKFEMNDINSENFQSIATIVKLINERQSSKAFSTLPPLVPVARDTHIPLSRAQQQIWQAHHLYPDNRAANSPIALRFTGMLSKEVLEKSINEIIRRHEIWRTTFPIKDEQPVQVIAPSLTLPLKIIDLQHLPLEKRVASAQRLAAIEAQHHFDLASDPLVKTTLLQLAPQEHWLLITMHHIITDGWSVGILLQELGMLYSAFSNGFPSPLPEVSVQYADFTLWERKWLSKEVLRLQLDYWLKKLANLPTSLDLLPTDQPHNSTISRGAKSYSLVFPENLVASIEAFSRSQSVTLFVIILTALKILLFKWSGQTDILVSASTANRSTLEIEKMLGCFINDVILRSEVNGSQTAIALLKQVKQTVNEAINNQDIGLEKINEITSTIEFIRTVSISMAPPVQGHTVHWHSQSLNCEVVSAPFEHELWHEAIPLELYVSSPTKDSKTIEIVACYSTDLFTFETIERLLSYYQEILQKLVRRPETQLSEFEWARDN